MLISGSSHILQSLHSPQPHLAGVKAAPRPREKAPPPLCGAGGTVVGLNKKRIHVLISQSIERVPFHCNALKEITIVSIPCSSCFKTIQERGVEVRCSSPPNRFQSGKQIYQSLNSLACPKPIFCPKMSF